MAKSFNVTESEMLIEQVKAARMQAMKDRDYIAKTILTTLVGELEGMSKRDQCEITDDMVVRTCKKFVVGNNETMKLGGNVEQLTAENTVLDKFVPKQLSEDELRVIIADMRLNNLGEIMQQLKAEHSGNYDGKLASGIAREFIELS